MKIRFVLPATLLLVAPALALSSVMIVRSDTTEENGATARATRGKDGAYDFTMTRWTRDPGNRLGEGGDEYTIVSTSELEIRRGDKLLAKTSVACEESPEKRVYAFSLARDCIPQSRFRITEHRVFKDPERQSRGGAIYECDIAEIGASAQAREPQHP
jgi:hypothetical protein